MQDHTSSLQLENAIALQKFGVGQPVRRKEDDTLVRGKGKYTDDFNLPGQAYAWIVRSSHAHGVIRGIDTSAAKTMPGVLGVWSGTDLTAAGYGPFTCGLPLKNRDGTPLKQTNRTRAHDRQGALCRRPHRVRGCRDAGAGARRRRSHRGRHRPAARRHRPGGSRKSRRAAALRSHPQQCGAGLSLWRRRQGRCGIRRRRACDETRYHQHPRRRGRDGAARGARRLGQDERALHHPGSDAGRIGQPHQSRQEHPEGSKREGAPADRQCRRLLRHEEHQLSRICLHPARGEGAGAAGEMDRRALHQFPVRQPRPRRARFTPSSRSMPRENSSRSGYPATAISAPTSPG